MHNLSAPRKIPFQEIIEALLDEENIFPPAYIHYFSDLDSTQLLQLKSIWQKIKLDRRIALLQDIKELSESDTTTFFENLSQITLIDPDPNIRLAGLEILWDTEDHHHIPRLLELFKNDPDIRVRAGAAAVLGEFVYLGELEKIPSSIHTTVVDTLISEFNKSTEPMLRQKIVEAIGYSTRDEANQIILSAYQKAEPSWVASALFAMGRSADLVWEKQVLASLDHPDIQVLIEAVRASGELELELARKPLLEIVKQKDIDNELHSAAIWSLSQIGGEEVDEVLEKLLEGSTDDDEIEFLEEALENLNFTKGVQQFRLLSVEKSKKNQWLKEVSLEDELEENVEFKIEDDEDERR